jgi:hypothetical protein
VKETAILHALFAVLVLVGFVAVSGTLQLLAFAAGGVCFVAGILLARRDSEDTQGGPAET